MRSGPVNERKMLRDQVAAFESLSSSQPIKLDIIDQDGKLQTIQLTARLLCFNFGVNKYAVNPLLSSVTGGWGISDALNEKGLEALIGEPNKKVMTSNSWVGAYLKKSSVLIKGMRERQIKAKPEYYKKLEKAIAAQTQK